MHRSPPASSQQRLCPRRADYPAPGMARVLMRYGREKAMRILLAIDDSACSAAATDAVIEQFTPAHTIVHVVTADDWPGGMPLELSFAEGPGAAHSILGLHHLRRENAASLVA